jgi:uncharacterized SAM-binding protein YcdF (DUF218 family)
MESLRFLLYPLPLALIIMLLAAIFAARGSRIAGAVLVAAFVGLWALATEPVSQALRADLENRYPAMTAASAPEADAIVVLGGGVIPNLPPRVTPELGHAGDRLRMGFDLYAAERAPRIITTGEAHFAGPTGQTQAAAMAELLRRWGVPEADIIIRGDAETTHGDALTVRRVAEREGLDTLLLVTTALHMRRSVAVFESQGLRVLPVPANFEGMPERPRRWTEWLPNAHALWISSRVWHEHLGLWHYRMRGYVE